MNDSIVQASSLQAWVDWSTIAVGLAAVVTLVITAFQLAANGRRAERKQASRVFVIPWKSRSNWDVDPSTSEPRWTGHLSVRVVNRSDAPVYFISVRLMSWDWETSGVRAASRLVGALQPRKKSAEIPFDQVPQPPDGYDSTTMLFPPVEIEFRDAGGRMWRRSADGTLKKLKPARRHPWLRRRNTEVDSSVGETDTSPRA